MLPYEAEFQSALYATFGAQKANVESASCGFDVNNPAIPRLRRALAMDRTGPEAGGPVLEQTSLNGAIPPATPTRSWPMFTRCSRTQSGASQELGTGTDWLCACACGSVGELSSQRIFPLNAECILQHLKFGFEAVIVWYCLAGLPIKTKFDG